jgi:predicted acetyltransferase
MAELVPPHVRYQKSFLEAAEEILWSSDDDHYAGLAVFPPVDGYPGDVYELAELQSTDTFSEFARRLRSTADEDSWFPDGVVPSTVLWWTEDDIYLGRLAIRHRMTPWLRDFGGHIGYVVRPVARQRGHATAMLAAALPVAHGLGIDPALVTCDDTNLASRKVIEANGGVYESQKGQKLRYWIPTSSAEST